MYHFFAKNENIGEDVIAITGDDVNHIKNVLRMKEGEELIISDEDGNDYSCELAGFEEEKAIMKVRFKYIADHELPCKIYLFQGLPKSDKMELIIQKCVELGIYEIVPVAMKRSIVKLDDKKEASKIKRWQAISESAAKQSKRSVIPCIHDVMSFKDAVNYAKSLDILLVPYENANGMAETRKVLGSIEKGRSIGIFIGPEGGFDDSEIELSKDAGANILSLGKRILRTETAGMTMLAMLMYELEE